MNYISFSSSIFIKNLTFESHSYQFQDKEYKMYKIFKIFFCFNLVRISRTYILLLMILNIENYLSNFFL